MTTASHNVLHPMSSLLVSQYNGGAAEWDGFVRRAAGWSHFHLYGWRTVLERVFRHECIYLAARDESNHLAGVLPLVRVRSVVFGHYIVSMPFLNYGGPLGDADAVRALAKEAVAIADRSGAKLLELRSRTDLPLDLPVSHRKLTVLLDLAETPELMFTKQLPSKLRSQIRRPMKDGVEVKIGPEQLDGFYQVFAHHMRDLGTPVMPRRFFAAALETFPDDMVIAVAYHQGKAIACGCGFLWNGEFEITWASALRSHNAMSPNMLVYWELMAHTIRRGGRIFNFGRATRGSGTHKFKLQWGSREEQLWWYQYGRGADVSHGATPSQDTGVFALASRVWQRMPVSVANRLGPSIVRFIP
jgi:FemAB-related protein (PEP-CTERM system-associated)